MEPLRLHLVRHGETEGESSIRYHGSNDVALSDLGRAQIRALMPHLAGLPRAPRHIWHSPLSRAAESARILAAGLGVAPAALRPVADFREICFGRFEGFTAEEIRAADAAFFERWQGGATDGFPDGEPHLAFASRVRRAWEQVATEWAAAVAEAPADALVVAHRGIVREGLQWLAGTSPSSRSSYAVSLGSVSTVVRRDQRWVVERLDVVG